MTIAFGWGILKRAKLELRRRMIRSEQVRDSSDRVQRKYRLDPGRNKPYVDYLVSGSDSSLADDIPIGANIQKNQWSLRHKVKGRVIDDFPRWIYSAIIGCGVMLFVAGTRRANRSVKKQNRCIMTGAARGPASGRHSASARDDALRVWLH